MPVIGASLSKLLEFDGQTRTLPIILKNSLDGLRDDDANLKSKTLFRSQPNEALAKVIAEYDSPNHHVKLLRYEADTIALLLLEWLNKLPEGLVTSDRYHKFVSVVQSLDVEGEKPETSSKLLRRLARAVKSQSSANTNALHYLLIYLRELAHASEANGLTIDVLAELFGSAIVRPDLDALTVVHEEDEDGEAENQDGKAKKTENGANGALSKEEVAAKATRLSKLIVWTLLTGFSTVFADLIVEDKETIPEEQLSDAIVQGKRANQHIRQSSSQLLIKKGVVNSASSENVASGGSSTSPTPGSLSQTPSKESLNAKEPISANSSSSNLAASSLAGIAASLPWPPTQAGTSLAADEDSGSASATTPSTTTKATSSASVDTHSPATSPSPGRAKSGSKSSHDGDSEEKEKKGLKGALRKLGFGKDKDKEKDKKDPSKSPARSRAGTVSGTPSPSPKLQAPEELPPNAVFRLTFEQLLPGEPGEPLRVIPNILRDCCEHLAQADRTKEFGIFRESGSFNEKARLMKAYDSPHVRIDFDASDAYTVAALVKEWLRALPDPLLTEKLYGAFKEAVSEDLDNTKSVQLLEAAIAQLPDARRACLQYLLHFMNTHVVAHQIDNRMGVNNVGIVLGPCLHRKTNPSSEELMDPCHNQIVVQFLTHYDTIFAKWSVCIPGIDSALTLYKKTSNLDRPASFLEKINQSIAAERSGTSTPVSDDASSNSGSPSNDIKLNKAKRKTSGIIDMWDRVKEETSAVLRRGRSGSEAPIATSEGRHKVSRSSSTKTPSVSRTESPPSSLAHSGTIVSGEESSYGDKVSISPKSSPRAPRLQDSSRHSSESKLAVRTVVQNPDGTTAIQIVPALTSSGQNSPRGSPPQPSSGKKRTPRGISSLSAEQVEGWLQDNAFGDLVASLKFMTGQQLLGLSKADMKSEMALRGVALWNSLHPDEAANQEHALSQQVAALEAKIDALLARLPAPEGKKVEPETPAVALPQNVDESAPSASTQSTETKETQSSEHKEHVESSPSATEANQAEEKKHEEAAAVAAEASAQAAPVAEVEHSSQEANETADHKHEEAIKTEANVETQKDDHHEEPAQAAAAQHDDKKDHEDKKQEEHESHADSEEKPHEAAEKLDHQEPAPAEKEDHHHDHHSEEKQEKKSESTEKQEEAHPHHSEETKKEQEQDDAADAPHEEAAPAHSDASHSEEHKPHDSQHNEPHSPKDSAPVIQIVGATPRDDAESSDDTPAADSEHDKDD